MFLKTRLWQDDQGVQWRRRGDGLLKKRRARALIMNSEVIVIHEYEDDVRVVAPWQRNEFWESVSVSLTERDADESGSRFAAVEFVDEAHHKLVMICEVC
jgi:hypothetical protein